jgi:hypothetical protein
MSAGSTVTGGAAAGLRLDADFLKRVYVTSTAVFALMLLMCLAAWRTLPAVTGLTAGFVIGLSPFLYWQWVITRAFSGSPRGLLIALLKYGLLKFPVLGVALYFSVKWNFFDPLALLAGMVVVETVVVLKVVGQIVSRRPR